MLVMRRKEAQWIEITHRSGDRIRVRVYNIRSRFRFPGQLDLAFDDSDHHFVIRRGERPRPKDQRVSRPAGEEAPYELATHEANGNSL